MHDRARSLRAALTIATLLAMVSAVQAQPSASQVMTDAGYSAGQIQRVLNGELVTGDVNTVSDKDLSVAMAFVVKLSPQALGEKILAGDVEASDPQVRQHGQFHGDGSLADLAGLEVSSDTAQTLLKARAGESLNLSTSEIAAFNALQGAANPQAAAQAQLQAMLLARLQAYRASGLAGIAPYARDGGQVDVGGELRKASQGSRLLQKYLPGFQAVLVGYPQATIAGMRQDFLWTRYDISGTPTYVLTQLIAAPDGDARVIAQRQYYASTGYNAEQALAALLPVREGTLVVYATHTFTDQVTGFGGAMKRSIGRKLMASKLEAVFEQTRNNAAP